MKNLTPEETREYIKYLSTANQSRQEWEYRQAVDSYKAAILRFGESAYLIRALANCYFQIGLYEGDWTAYQLAIDWIKKAINLEPNNDQLHTELGKFYSIGTLEYQEAAQEYRIAIELNPYNLSALLSGVALYGVPEKVVTLEEAIVWFERVVQLEPAHPTHHFRLGKLYHEAGKNQKAETEWLRALLCPRPLNSSIERAIINLIEGTN